MSITRTAFVVNIKIGLVGLRKLMQNAFKLHVSFKLTKGSD